MATFIIEILKKKNETALHFAKCGDDVLHVGLVSKKCVLRDVHHFGHGVVGHGCGGTRNIPGAGRAPLHCGLAGKRRVYHR